MKLLYRMVLKTCLASIGSVVCLHCIYAEQVVDIDKVIVIVNDTALTKTKIDRQWKLAQQRLLERQGESTQRKLSKKHVIEEMIKKELEWQLVKHMEFILPKSELNKLLVKAAQANNVSLETEQDQEDFKKELLTNELRMQIGASQMKEPTDFEIQMQLRVLPKDEKTTQEVQYHLERLLIPEHSTPRRQWWNYVKAKLGFKIIPVKNKIEEIQHILQHKKHVHSFSEILTTSQIKTWDIKDLKWRTESQLPELYLSAVRTLKPQEISKPLQDSHGLHIIRLIAKKGAMSHEKVRFRYILLKSRYPTQDVELKETLQKIRAIALKKRNFQEQVEKYSEDPKSVLWQGEEEWMQVEQLEEEMRYHVKHLRPNEISQPFKTLQGWCLVKLLERTLSLSDTSNSQYALAKAMVQQQKMINAIEEWRQELYSRAYIQWIDPDFITES